MKVVETNIPEVKIIEPKVFGDEFIDQFDFCVLYL